MNNLGRGKENEKKDKNKLLSRETVGIVLELFAALTLVIVVTDNLIFGGVGHAIRSFLLGVFGFGAYAVLAAWIYGGAVLITGKKLTASRKTVALCVLCFLFLVCLVHTITADVGNIPYGGYGAYLGDCYAAGANGYFGATGGGVIIGLIVYPIAKLTTSVGGYIIFSLLMLGMGYLVYRSVKGNGAEKRRAKARREQKERTMVDRAASDTSALYDLNYAGNEEPSGDGYADAIVREVSSNQNIRTPNNAERSRRLYSIGDEFDLKTKRELRQESRREEEERRMAAQQYDDRPPEQQPLSAYQQSRQILYPDTPPQYPFSSYSGASSSSGASSGRSSASSSPAYSSYTSNGIFDSDSYFNKRRGAISGAQYADNFRSPSSERPERSVPGTSPAETSAPQASAASQPAQSAPTYSELYKDGLEENVSYSAVPKKIVTDTTVPQPSQTPRAEQPQETDPAAEIGRESAQPRTYSVGRESYAEPVRAEHPSAPSSAPLPPPVEEPLPPRRGMTEESAETPVRRNMFEESDGFAERRTSAAAEDDVPFARRGDAEDIGGRAAEHPSVQNERELPPRRGADMERTSSLPETESGEEDRSALQRIPEDFESAVNLFDDEEEEPSSSAVPDAMESVSRRRGEDGQTSRLPSRQEQKQAEEPVKKKHIYARYKAPSLDLLQTYAGGAAVDPEEMEHNKNTIVETLSDLRIPCEVVKVTQGPAVTRYDIEIPGNIPTGRVLGCDKELAMRLRAASGVNVQPNYENGTISIEVPNKQRATVGLKDIINTEQFSASKPGKLLFGIGKDIEGRAILGDIVDMKHLLVAGSTGSGKSVCLNALIISLLYKYSPEELRIILVDPKQVEFNIYDRLPHLMINEIIYEPAKVINVLNWCINEMERRYSLFKQKTKSVALVRDIDEYNAHLLPDEERLPKIVLIIDELADLMQAAKKEIEDRIQRLTQKSRAAGIHLVLATQRPSVNVITGVIKTNLPTRIAFKVTSGVDSQTILDENGAEKLLGKGDMLYRTDVMPFPQRLQGAFLHSDEVQRVVEYVKENNEAYFDDSVADYINNDRSGGGGEFGGDDDDSVEAVYIDALRYVVGTGQASISMIQRKCSVGYPKAGKIIEWMENMGYISAFNGARARDVLLTKEEFESKYGDYGD